VILTLVNLQVNVIKRFYRWTPRGLHCSHSGNQLEVLRWNIWYYPCCQLHQWTQQCKWRAQTSNSSDKCAQTNLVTDQRKWRLVHCCQCLAPRVYQLSKPLVCSHEQFLPARRYASAGNRHSNVSVCPSVCLSVRLSRAGIVSKRRKLAAWFLHHLVAPRL